ncbi:antibiotic biosynthesis monooxygenase family protein [Kitasatospora aureofaciens]|uniref:antibiotic biosynthesis monooxygenase family protein n=1 Tax=Kitasatospora aureofaciens TaxID=1894 RepID=UPI0036F4A02E
MSDHPEAPAVSVEAFEPPYCGAAFTAVRTPDQSGYSETDARVKELVRDIPGYLGMDYAQSPDGPAVTVGYFRDAEALTAWRTDVEHRAAQQRGRAEWYQRYSLHVAEVERSHGSVRAEAPQD